MARGGKRPGAGRPKGVPNKATRPMREAAREYTEQALLTLAEIMKDEDQTGPARVAAANALLDRGYGKPAQPIDGDGEGGAIPVAHLIELVGVEPGEV